MKKRGDPCGCIARFINHNMWEKILEARSLQYEDDVCYVEYSGGVIKAVAYEVVSGTRYKIGECIAPIW